MRGDYSPRTGWARLLRAWPAYAVFIVFIPAALAAEPRALTERQAIELALSRPVYRELEAARLAIAGSAVTEANQLPNPVVAWERDRVSGAAGRATESTAKVFQTVDFSGRRALRREAAGMRMDAAHFDQEERRLNTVTEVRRLFGEALYRQEAGNAYARWLQRIEAATKIVRNLVTAGEAAGYDRRRLEREAQTAKARAAGIAADYARLREAMAGLIGKSGGEIAALTGELLPANAPALVAVQSNLRQRPDLASMDAQSCCPHTQVPPKHSPILHFILL